MLPKCLSSITSSILSSSRILGLYVISLLFICLIRITYSSLYKCLEV